MAYEISGLRDERGRPACGSSERHAALALPALPGADARSKCKRTRLLVLAATLAEIHAEPADAHAPDRVVAGKEMALRELIEDELLLAVPYAPRHERLQARGRAGDERESVSPFAGLRGLMRQQTLITRRDQGESNMAVHQNKKSPSRRGMRRSHDHLSAPRDRGRADQRRDAPAPPRQPDRLLPRQEGRQDAGRVGALITVAVDCMGGDHGPHVTVPAALEFLAQAGRRRARAGRAARRDRGASSPRAARRSARGCACTTRRSRRAWTSRRRRRCATRRTRRCASPSTW